MISTVFVLGLTRVVAVHLTSSGQLQIVPVALAVALATLAAWLIVTGVDG